MKQLIIILILLCVNAQALYRRGEDVDKPAKSKPAILLTETKSAITDFEYFPPIYEFKVIDREIIPAHNPYNLKIYSDGSGSVDIPDEDGYFVMIYNNGEIIAEIPLLIFQPPVIPTFPAPIEILEPPKPEEEIGNEVIVKKPEQEVEFKKKVEPLPPISLEWEYCCDDDDGSVGDWSSEQAEEQTGQEQPEEESGFQDSPGGADTTQEGYGGEDKGDKDFW